MMGRKTMPTTASAVPTSMKGMRRPRRLWQRSESEPKNGRRKRARTLSAAMIMPEKVSSRWNVFVSMSGTTLLYICQNAQMEKNAKPIRTVLRTLSFTGSS